MVLHNINIERSILASILFNPENIIMCRGKILFKDFYLPSHRYIYEVMEQLEDEDKPIDEEFIKEALMKMKRWDEDAMLEIFSTHPLPNLEAYLEELKAKSQRRDIVELANQIRVKVIDGEEEVHEVLSYIAKTNDDISNNGFVSKTKGMNDIGDEFYKEFKEAGVTKDYVGFKSGIIPLDNIIGAFVPGDLVVVCARPSMGKTSFATTVTNYADQSGVGVLFDSLEMQAKQIFRRLHSQRAKESLSDIKRGVMQNPENFNRSLRELRNTKNIIIHDESYISVHQLIAKASVIFRKNPHIKYWIIDHLRYIKKESKKDTHIEVGEIVKMIKKAGKEYGVVVLLLSQLNREMSSRTNKRPILSDIRDSGAVEEDAEIILGLHRESYYTRSDPSIPEPPINPAEIHVLKNRDGRCGIARCEFDGPHTCFNSFSVSVHEYREPVIEFGGKL